MEGLGLTQDFWHGKSVLLTGHTGFKGSWLALWLRKLGANVAGYSLEPPSEPNLFCVANVSSGMTSVTGDVRDLSRLEQTINEQSPEVVFHLAAQSLVRQSYSDPVETYSTNVMGTVNVLEAVRHSNSVGALIIITSDKCYENREWVWPYRENEPLGGKDPYSSSKACTELVAAAYRNSFFSGGPGQSAAVATTRAGNVVGGGDWAQDRIVPDCIRAFISGRPVELRYPEAVRPWQHVLEPLNGYLMLARRLLSSDGQAFSEAWNFGPYPGEDSTVLNVARKIGKLWGNGSVSIAEPKNIPNEAGLLRLDNSKAVDRLNWRPRWGLDQTLRETVSWYRAWHGGEDMHRYCLDQISSYESEI